MKSIVIIMLLIMVLSKNLKHDFFADKLNLDMDIDESYDVMDDDES